MSGIPNERAVKAYVGSWGEYLDSIRASSEDYYEDNSPCRWCFKDTCYGCELVPEPEDRPDYDEEEAES